MGLNSGTFLFNEIVSDEKLTGFICRFKDLSKILPSYTELKEKNFPFFKLTTDLTSPLQVIQTSQPVFAAQANFIKGGLLLTVGAHHSACDPTGLDSIIDTWAINTSVVGTPKSFCEYDPISNDRTPLCRGLPANIADFPEYIIQPSPPTDRSHMVPPTFEMPPMISKIFYFSPEHLVDLKTAAKSYLTYDSILAFFWHHMTKARNPTLDANEDEKTSSVCFAIDVRIRTSPPLPPTYFGNATVGGITKRLSVTNLTASKSGLPLAAAAIRSAVNTSKEPSRIPLTIGLLSSRPNPQDFKFASNAFLGPDLTATSWADVGVRDREWGVLGKPEGFRMPYEGVDGTIALLPRLEGGGLEVMAALESKAMERMVENKEFWKFAVDWA